MSEVSVIIACKNPGRMLNRALESVWTQRGIQPELIVVDGGSTDGSAEWLQEHSARLTWFFSEPDTGVYAAMNKGVKVSVGQWLLFLGSDDRLADPDVLATACNILRVSVPGVVAGEARYGDGRIYRFQLPFHPVRRNFLHHQATFYRRELFSTNGCFDESLQIAADYDFNLRLWKAGVTFSPLSLRISECGIRGVSDSGKWSAYREEIAVRHRHLSGMSVALWDAGSVTRFVRKQVLRRIKHV